MPDPDPDKLRQWIGRSRVVDDLLASAPLKRLSATIGVTLPDEILPPLAHWLYFLQASDAAGLAADGHATTGDFLPPVALPRRMWAGSRVEFLTPLRVNEPARRESTVTDVAMKNRGNRQMVFVTVQHEVSASGRVALREEQRIVYLDRTNSSNQDTKPHVAPGEAQWSKELIPDPVLLFRYSALTFNAHRIHYDRDYAVNDEGYPGLVVHGPLAASLLITLLQSKHPDFVVRLLEIRAQKPLFDTGSFSLNGRRDGDVALLWTLDHAGDAAMRIDVEGT